MYKAHNNFQKWKSDTIKRKFLILYIFKVFLENGSKDFDDKDKLEVFINLKSISQYVSYEKKIQYPLFAQVEISAESIKSAQELPKIEIKYRNISNNMWCAK